MDSTSRYMATKKASMLFSEVFGTKIRENFTIF